MIQSESKKEAWIDELLVVLRSLTTTPSHATGETPFTLVYDLVLRLYSITHPKNKDKLSPKWEGPYRISKMIGPGTYKLEKLNVDAIPRTWHASNLTKYYV
ncbi:hypothetical protein LIER_35900 [Lithospermum erythrorhizon]|uniref:Tf2-1-like SH3-like domain-containing protein n=1 Tax=Lithospermum erythrorhizon TaxID=34254 RepID=A0AAV3NXX0_LITER